MLVQVTHKPTGKIYLIEAHQVSVHADTGEPVAVSYEQAGYLVHSDRSHKDFDRVVTLLALENVKNPSHAGT